MDLIYTDTKRTDVGVLTDYTLDLAFGSDENNFELVTDLNRHCCEANCLVYIEDTEYGGIIDGLGVITKDDKLTYVGRTWQGILESKVIEPDEGEAYFKVSGEANAILGQMFDRLGLSNLFVASEEDSGLVIDSYSFDRYVGAYTGIKKMVELVSGKLKFAFKGGMVTVSTLPAVDYSQDEQFDNDTVEMEVESFGNTVNHLICLGKGELEERKVVHLYVDVNGNISGIQSFFGIDERTVVYDYPNAESEEKMVEDGVSKLQELANPFKVQMNFSADESIYDVGDSIGAKEIVTGVKATAKITKKIVTINKGEVTIQYKVGE